MAGQNGGAREGAGRKPTGRRKINFYITEAEEQRLRAALTKIRAEEVQKTNTSLITTPEELQTKKQSDHGRIMKMANCKHYQAWGDGVDEKPIAGQVAWCAWCQKMERIEVVV